MAKLAAMARDEKAELQDIVIQLGKSVPCLAAQILEDMGESSGPLGFLRPPGE